MSDLHDLADRFVAWRISQIPDLNGQRIRGSIHRFADLAATPGGWDVTAETVEAWKAAHDRFGDRYQRAQRHRAAAFCDWLVSHGELAANPFRPPGRQATNGETLAPLIDRYLRSSQDSGRMSFETARRSGYRLARLSVSFGARPLSHFNEAAVERWLDDLGRLSPGTRRLNLSTARAFCNWLVRQGLIVRNPTLDLRVVKPRTVPRALAADDVRLLFEKLPDERARAIVGLMVYCGLRCVEVARLQWGDYDQRERTLLVKGKGGHERVLPVPAPAARLLEAYRAAESAGDGPVVRSRNEPGQGVTPLYLSRLVAAWMSEAGVKRRRFDGVAAHALRHTAASDVLDRSGDLRAVQEMLGHRDLNTTAVYLRRASLARLTEAMEGRDYTVDGGRQPQPA